MVGVAKSAGVVAVAGWLSFPVAFFATTVIVSLAEAFPGSKVTVYLPSVPVVAMPRTVPSASRTSTVVPTSAAPTT